MPELHLDTLHLPVAPLGPESPLPPLPGPTDVHARADLGAVSGEMFDLAYGRVPSVLPYTLQDGYGRERGPGGLRVAVLENEHLRATVALDLGGRLWSLVDKETGRELLYRNPVFQPANLALRGAWFSGGVEWNLGTTGHTPLTCAPMHASRVDTPDGPVLRVWEFERLREVPYQIDFCLPDGSRFLYVHVRIVNTQDVDVPMYWWSNIAVRAGEGTRVIAPADASYRFAYEGSLELIDAPVHNGLDYSYPEHAPHAADYFFRLENGRRPWIAAVDADGRGLLQASTARLTGRKLFVWGENAGGRRWQDWLTEPGTGGYLEIQAGLARTQLEHLPMSAGDTWAWVEAYGALDVDPAVTHAPDWAAARDAVQAQLDERLPVPALNSRLDEWTRWCDLPPAERLSTGSGWGALERRRRQAVGAKPADLPGIPFRDDTLTAEQEPWLALLDDGALPTAGPAVPPAAHISGPGWLGLLEEAAATADWHGSYQLGLARVAAGDSSGARDAWERSAEATPNAWALRALAHQDRTDPAVPGERAADRYLAAHRLAPPSWQFAVEACDALLAVGRLEDAKAVLDELPEPDRTHGRVSVCRVRVALAGGELDQAAAVFAEGFDVPDLREGEISLDGLWNEVAERTVAGTLGLDVNDEQVRAKARRDFPLPGRYDFRMTGE
ncbi:DUF5107 domain-containing protein [Phytomonospora endophytica]|uniref:DUF5107 domain-containing protein n=1 Tax=Phytomonospora endophytica TaxID=714109 RepID=A0A841F734_9ACTN|nr:DUF5107 domain-containing protein [Phytomonospora endophytica]MBB6032801.1 hypothetical protein [Phytomonospora endophytica]GIG66050.1 hypothetical protein Pen01_23450 [Phytomonospora endophytica]